ncbi:D-isomer specific 2-hydroxyacid dehydrogenase family protein [Forsythia ovata]|uniref:D-isomer specific 2-hydroxyacid dehydrogenase family protein n=1 Tax=Forsythia ovata TaxID=205694 RepID=A0ABD1TQJ9_9LAMI
MRVPTPNRNVLTNPCTVGQGRACDGKSPITAHMLSLLPSLQLVITSGTEVNHIDIPECRCRGISVANTGDVFSDDTADYAVGLLIDVLRKISAGERHVRRGAWPVNGDFLWV